MAIKKFNSIDGFSVGSDTPIAVIDNVANVSANSLLVSNLSNLGNVGNITITGGSAGFVLQTDGTGNLTFVDPTSTGVAGSNTQVQFNNNNSFGASPNFTFNSASSTLSVTNLSVTTNSNSSNVYTTNVYSTNVYSSNYYSPTGDLNLYAGSGNSSISLTTTGNGTIDVNDTRITSLATPQFDNDAATKKYVDDVAQGLNIHDSCKVATTANIATLSGGTVAYNNGASGVGANLVITGGSITTIDTYSLQNLDRILVKNEANLTWNGIYTWATGGTVLTRATDFDTPTEIEGGDFTFVTDGNVYQNTGWVQTDNVITIGTDSIEWQQFSGAGTYEAGNGLSLTGTVFSVNVDTNTIEINSDVLRVKANAQFVTPDIDSATGNSLTLSTSGYIQAGNLVTANYFTGTLTTASQPNITSLGNLINLSVTGSATIGGNTTIAGNANVSGNIFGTNYVIANYFTGIITTTHQPNIESVGNLVGLTVSNVTGVVNFNTTANVSLGNISNLHILGGGSGYVLKTDGTGNLSWGVDSTSAAGSNGDVQFNDNGSLGANSNFNFNKTTSVLTVTGNLVTTNADLGNLVTANYFTGNGALLTFVTGSNVSGNVDNAIQSHYANIANSVAGANVNGQVGNALIAGTVYINAQPNITSLGTLSSLSVTANVTAGNITGANLISANYLVGDGSLLSNINAANIVGAYSNSNVANYLPTYTGNISANYFIGNGATLTFITGSNVSGNVDSAVQSHYANIANSVSGSNVSGNVADAIHAYYADTANSVAGANVSGQVGNALIAGTVYTAAQPNITSVGSLTSLVVSGDATVTGNLTVSGNTNYINVDTLVVQDPIIEMGGGPNGAPLASNDGKDRGSLLHYYTTSPVDAFMGWDNSNAEFAFGSNVNTSNEVVTFNSFGNIRAGYFIGNGATLTSITGTNVTGNVDYAVTSNWANTANSILGTNVSGNVDSAIQSHYANIANSVSGSNVNGQVGNALIAGTVYTNAQPNITSVGTLTGLTVDGLTDLGDVSNLYISGGSAGYVLTTDGYGELSWEQATGNSGASFVSIRKDNFVGNGVQTQFSLTASPSGEDAVEVNLNGLIQQGYVYNVVGSNVVFTTPPVSGANIEITTFGALAINQTDSQILFIDGSNLVGSNNFTFTESNNTLSVNNVSSTANITAGNIKSDNLLYANGSPYIFTTSASGSNTQVQFNDSNSFAGSANFTFDKGTNTLSVTNIIANGSGITYITGSNVTGNVDYAINSNWANIANSVSGANVSGQVGNALVAGTVYTADQPNITSVGTLTSLVVSGNATITGNLTVSGTTEYTNVNNLYIKDPIIEMGGGANGDPLTTNDGKDRGTLLHYYTTGTVDAFMGWDNSNAEFAFGSNVSVSSEVVTFNSFGNIRANYFIGDGSLLTNINAANITGAYSNTNVAAYLPTYTGNISANYFIGNGSTLTNITGANVTGYVSLATTANTAGTVTTAAQPNITSVGNLTTLTVTGNVSANYFIGNGSSLIDITGSNVTGYVPNANLANTATVAGTVTTNAQPNITSVGTLANLTVTGNLSAGNVAVGSGTGGSLTGANLISANYFAGDGSLLTNINASNITGSYGNANVANYLPTYTGNVSANYFIGNGSTLTNITGSNVIGNVSFAITSNWANIANSVSGSNVSGNVADAVHAYYADVANSVVGANVSGNVDYAITSNWANTANSISGSNVTGQVGNALIAGTVYTNAQPNITSVGTLSSLDVTGNISAGNANLGNTIIANYFIGNGSLLTGLPAQYANSNVANYLPTYTGNVSANYFIGNGSSLTNITGSNVSGNVDFAITSNWANTANSVAGANVSGTVANATYATSAGSADSATTANTVTTSSQPNITSFGTLTELTVDGLTDLGPIGNVTITGGTSGYVLTTNGAGDLSWQAAGGSAGPGFVNITKNSFTGNGVQTIFTLTTTPASEASLLVNIDGITQQDAAYSLIGSDVTFASAPLNGEIVEIVSYGSIGIGSNTTVLFNDAGDIGNTSTFSFNKYSNTLSVTNIDTTSITFDTGVITVAGANAGIFTSGVDNINFGLGANVTVGSSSGNTTVQGNLIAGNVSITSNLAISGTATISNLKVNDLYSNRTPISVTTNTIVDSFSVNKYRSAKYTMRVNSDDGYQAVEVLLIHDGVTSYVTIYGSLSTIGTDIVTLSSNILSGNVRLLATTGSANTTVNLLGTYVAD